MFTAAYFFHWLGLTHCVIWSPDITDYSAYTREGDINIGFMTSIHNDDTCSKTVSIGGTLNSEQIAFAVNAINNSTEILPNITLGFVVLDSCGSELRALARSVYFLKDNTSSTSETGSWFEYPGDREIILPGSEVEQEMYGSPQQYDIAGLVGLTTSRQTINVAALMNAFRVPVISHLATSDELSDRQRFPFFLRVVPPDRFSAAALIDIMLHFNWSYVSLLYTEGSYGENGAKQIEQLLEKQSTELCISFSYRISSTANNEEYEWIASKLMHHSNARVVLMFCDSPQQRKLLATLERLNMKNMFLFLVSDTFVGWRDINEGALFIGHKNYGVDGFSDYLKNNTPWKNPANPWLLTIWQTYFDCSWVNSTENRNKSCYRYEMPEKWVDWYGKGNSRIYDAVFSLAHGFHNHITLKCPSHLGSVDKVGLRSCLRDDSLMYSLMNISFKGVTGTIAFDDEGNMLSKYEVRHYKKLSNGGFASVTVGEWNKHNNSLTINTSMIDWSMFKPTNMTAEPSVSEYYVPPSVCSTPCAPGYVYIYKEGKCCWQCNKCRKNEVVTPDNRSTCVRCPLLTWPNQESFAECLPISPEYMQLTNYSAIIIMIFGFGGIILTFLASLMYWTHRNHRLVRATSRELSFCTLLGSLFSSSSAMAFVLKPSQASCLISILGFHYSVNVLYSSMLVKTVRIFRIFNIGSRSTRRPRFVSPFSQMIIVISLIISEVLTKLSLHSTLFRKYFKSLISAIPVSVSDDHSDSCRDCRSY